MSLPHASVDVGGPRPVIVAHRGRLDVAYARAYGMTSSRITPKPGLALSSVTDDASFAYTCALQARRQVFVAGGGSNLL